MIFFTFEAEKIYISKLPCVNAVKISMQSYPVKIERSFLTSDGIKTEIIDGSEKRLSLPVSFVNNNTVFVVEKTYYNGEYRNIVKKTKIVTGEIIDNYYEIVKGLDRTDIIISGYNELNDGDFIILKN